MRDQKTQWLAVSTADLLIIGSWEQALPKSHAPEENARPEVRVVQGKVLGTLVEGGIAFGPNLPPWPRYSRTDDPYLAISAEHTTAFTHLRGEICPLYVAHWSNAASYDTLAKD
jgi:hypothetical protein